MRKTKIALLAALAATPLALLNAGATESTAPHPAVPAELQAMQNAGGIVDGTEVQSWGCCWFFWMGSWYCLPC